MGPLALAEWYVMTTAYDPWTGTRQGSPEWPEPGGFLNQPARLVDAVEILRAEFPRVVEEERTETPRRNPGDDDPTKALRVNRRRA